MTVESATYTSGLNASNPASGDPFIEGDDHIRLLKSTIKATFPNITGAVTATHTEINAAAAGSFTTLSTSGNVGIGGTPSRKLHVINYGTAPQAGIARISGNSTVGAITNSAALELEITAGGGAPIIQSITNQYTAVNGYEFTSTFHDSAVWRDIATNTERLKITASGNVLVSSPAGLGYGTGAGGTVTQATSRNTAVAAINKPTGAITLVSAAGSVTPFTFTVPNSLVAVDDVIALSVRSGANRYIVFVSSIAAGSFNITGYALSGTATEAPIINFAVIKGASI